MPVSIHALLIAPCGRALGVSIRAPRAGRDPADLRYLCWDEVSIHAPRAGATPLPTLSGRRARFQSTRPVRGATSGQTGYSYTSTVSIHAPRAGRDPPHDRNSPPPICFNPRAPCGARRRGLRPLTASESCFNPRAPCGARPWSIVVLRADWLFQSTRPVRGATAQIAEWAALTEVSIHAPRAGRDRPAWRGPALSPGFNPRAPCGARRLSVYSESGDNWFQSTRPVRGATSIVDSPFCRLNVSIHAPRAGRDTAHRSRGR